MKERKKERKNTKGMWEKKNFKIPKGMKYKCQGERKKIDIKQKERKKKERTKEKKWGNKN